MPKVSICIPAYKNPAGIARLLSSVKEQTYRDYEVIVTDDSPDDSVEKVVWEAGLPGLRYQRNPARLGATQNWNEAVRLSRGSYMKMMHHDDWFAGPDSLERLVKLLEGTPGAGLAFCGTRQVDLTGKETPFDRHIAPWQLDLIRGDFRNLFLGNYIGAPSAVLYKRTGLEYAKELTWLVDVEYYMRLLQQNPCFVSTTDPLVCIGVSESQLTRQCSRDGDLNLYEYGFLYREFQLSEKAVYQKKLIEVALTYHKPYAAIKPYGIGYGAYTRAFWQKKGKDLLFLAGVAKRKLTGAKR